MYFFFKFKNKRWVKKKYLKYLNYLLGGGKEFYFFRVCKYCVWEIGGVDFVGVGICEWGLLFFLIFIFKFM